MSRQLILIRHAKSVWVDFSLPDFDRPLQNDCISDVEYISESLQQLHLKPDLILCSPAKRTRQTTEYLCRQLTYPTGQVVFEMRLYETDADEYLRVIQETNEQIRTLLLVGHNPSLTDLSNYFLKNKIAELPTTGVVWLETKHNNWLIDRHTVFETKYLLSPTTN